MRRGHARAPRSRRVGAGLVRPVAALGAIASGLLLAFSFAGVATQGNALARDIAALSRGIAAEQARQAALQAEAAEKATDSYVIDKAKQYGYVRPGEGIVVVQGQSAPAADASSAVRPSRPGRLARWTALFFGAR